MTIRPPSGPDGVCTPGSSGINVIIVGAGIAGLSAAIECHRKGHVVTVYEKASGLRKVGDSITLSRNGARVVAKWGNGKVHGALNKLRAHASYVEIRDRYGKFLGTSDLRPYQEGEGYVVSRPGLAEVFYNHARELGIAVHHDCRVTDYWETEKEAGIIINGKERVGADCVVHADGAHSGARAFVAGQDPKPTSSGCAILRACFDSTLLREDPDASWILDHVGRKDTMICFVGDDGSDLVVGTLQHGAKVLWICTHQDTSTARESWNTPTNMKEVLERMRHWSCQAKLEPIIRHTPEHLVVNYHLVTRPPLDRWVSIGGRMILIGDAAHPYSPKAGQGACQAIEDAAVVAAALELAGPENVCLSLHVAEKIRYQRALTVYRMGETTHNAFHNVDWDKVAKNPGLLTTPNPAWLFGHDCQEYCYQEFDRVADALRTGEEYVPHNVPLPGQDIWSNDYVCILSVGEGEGDVMVCG